MNLFSSCVYWIRTPYWNAKSRGVLSGLTRDTGVNEIVRAIAESVAYQTYDLFEVMKMMVLDLN